MGRIPNLAIERWAVKLSYRRPEVCFVISIASFNSFVLRRDLNRVSDVRVVRCSRSSAAVVSLDMHCIRWKYMKLRLVLEKRKLRFFHCFATQTLPAALQTVASPSITRPPNTEDHNAVASLCVCARDTLMKQFSFSLAADCGQFICSVSAGVLVVSLHVACLIRSIMLWHWTLTSRSFWRNQIFIIESNWSALAVSISLLSQAFVCF